MTGALEVKTALELIEIAKKQGWIDKLWTVFSKKYTVLVFGTSGVGKTNFITSLTELVPNAIDALNRTKIAEKHRVKILDHPFTFIDTPGEELQAPQRIRVIQEALRKGVSGIINAAAYGYHEGPASKADVLDGGAVRDSYLAQRREIEISAIREWAAVLGAREVSNWLITVVTKADLWWDSKETILKYYETGPYYDALGSAKTLNPVVLGYCSVVHKFYGECPVSGAFDDSDRVKIRAHFLCQLVAAIK